MRNSNLYWRLLGPMYSLDSFLRTSSPSQSLSETLYNHVRHRTPMKSYNPHIKEFDFDTIYPIPKTHAALGWTEEQFNSWLRGMVEALKKAPRNKAGYTGYFGLYNDVPSKFDPKAVGYAPPRGTTSCYGSAASSWGHGKGHIPIYGEYFQGSKDAKNTPFFEYLICRKHSPFAPLLPDSLRAVYDNKRCLKGFILIDTSEASALSTIAVGLMHRMIQAGGRGDLFIKFREAGASRLEAMLLAQLHLQNVPIISYSTIRAPTDDARFIQINQYHTCLDWNGSTYSHGSTFSLPKFLEKRPTLPDDAQGRRKIWDGKGYSPCNIIWGCDINSLEHKVTVEFREALSKFYEKFFNATFVDSAPGSKWNIRVYNAPKPKDQEEVNLRDSEYILAVTKWFKDYRKKMHDVAKAA